MATSIFDNKAEMPDDTMLKDALGETKALWDGLSGYIQDNYPKVKSEWKFYSKKAGWSLIFKSKDRTLLYLIPCEQYFKVCFVFGEKAINTAKESDLPPEIIKIIGAATAYAEGTSFFIDMRERRDMDRAFALLKIKSES